MGWSSKICWIMLNYTNPVSGLICCIFSARKQICLPDCCLISKGLGGYMPSQQGVGISTIFRVRVCVCVCVCVCIDISYFTLHVCHFFLGIATIKLADIDPKMAAIPFRNFCSKKPAKMACYTTTSYITGMSTVLSKWIAIISPHVLDTSHSWKQPIY